MDDRFSYCGYDLENLDEMKMDWWPANDPADRHPWLWFAVKRACPTSSAPLK
jgi:hypothetical protein